jgi:predicted amidophosphoribosyltransferase
LLDRRPPAACPGCAEPLGPTHDLCGPAGGRCLRCVVRPRGFDAACSAVVYTAAARRVVLRIKLGRRPELLGELGSQLARAVAARGWPRERPLVVPVPAHPLRRLSRGFDPALTLARTLSRRLRLPLAAGLLARHPFDRRRRGQGAARRRRAALAAYRLRRRARCSGTVLLVDDVLTSGATAEACARHLRAAGAVRVLVATWARTPFDRPSERSL